MVDPMSHKFEPDENISALEVAELLPVLIGIWTRTTLTREGIITEKKITLKELKLIPEHLRHHFKSI